MNMQIAITAYGQHYRTVALNQPKMILGRSPDCDIAIDDRNLSRQHIEILQQNGQIVVRDLGSTNGTKLGNQQLLAQKYALWTTASSVVIGDYILRLENIAESDATTPFILRDPEQTDVYKPVAPASYASNEPSNNMPRPNTRYVAGTPQASAAAATLQPRHGVAAQKQATGCMAFLDAFLKVSEHFSTIKYLTLFLLSPVKNTMLVVEHYEGHDMSGRDKYGLCKIEPYKFLASGFGFFLVLLTVVNFLAPDANLDTNEFVVVIVFALTMLITILSSFFVFKMGTGSKRKREGYMIMSAIMSGVQLAAIPFLFVLVIFTLFSPWVFLVLLALYLYLYIYYYLKLQKVFWQISYVRTIILSIIASIPSILIVTAVDVAMPSSPASNTFPTTYYPSAPQAPDTITLDVTSGGTVSPVTIFGATECIGDFPNYLDTYWDYSYWYELRATGMNTVQFTMSSRVDTVLVVQAPNGVFYCNDDTNDVNPVIIAPASTLGRYNMWVGNFSGRYEPGVLTITARP